MRLYLNPRRCARSLIKSYVQLSPALTIALPMFLHGLHHRRTHDSRAVIVRTITTLNPSFSSRRPSLRRVDATFATVPPHARTYDTIT